MASLFRPNVNASFATERLSGTGTGLLIAALVLADGHGAKGAAVGLLGVAIMLASYIASIVIRRKQVARTRLENRKALEL